MRLWVVLAYLLLVDFPLVAQTGGALGATLRLPLPVDPVAGAKGFEAAGPVAGVLTGLLIPSSGPLTAWAPVFSTLGADGRLTEAQTGAWIGPRPERWLKVVKPGSVVAGFRALVRTSPLPVQTRQIQVYWKPWTDGTAAGALTASRVYGAPAGTPDQVRIVDLTLPAGKVPTGLWGETAAGAVVQVSLLVRKTQAEPQVVPQAGTAPGATRGPPSPRVPTVGPVAPVVPRLE